MTATAIAISDDRLRSGDVALDVESLEWLWALSSTRRERDGAGERLHALLLRAARAKVARRRPPVGDLDDLAVQAADGALVAALRKPHTYRGDSRFTT